MMAAVRALASLALSWLFVTAACFAAIHALPGDPVETHLLRLNVAAPPETVASLRAEWGLDRPLPLQFLSWASGFLTLEWGRSFETGAELTNELGQRLPWSASIGVGGMVLAVMAGSTLGFAAAARPGGLADAVSRAFAVLGQALPAFAVGLIALWLLAAELQVIRPFSGGPVMRLVLPMALVACFSVGSVSRLVRIGFIEVHDAPYYMTALSKGLSRRAALWRHGRRHAGLTLLAGLAPELGWIVGGTAVAEIVFGVPGLSERVVQAVTARDYAVLQVYVALVTIWVILGLRFTAFLRRALDPRST